MKNQFLLYISYINNINSNEIFPIEKYFDSNKLFKDPYEWDIECCLI